MFMISAGYQGEGTTCKQDLNNTHNLSVHFEMQDIPSTNVAFQGEVIGYKLGNKTHFSEIQASNQPPL